MTPALARRLLLQPVALLAVGGMALLTFCVAHESSFTDTLLALVGGRRLSVWWQGEGRWFDGRLRGEVKEENGRRLERVEYDDGDAEWHELSGVHWMPLSR